MISSMARKPRKPVAVRWDIIRWSGAGSRCHGKLAGHNFHAWTRDNR